MRPDPDVLIAAAAAMLRRGVRPAAVRGYLASSLPTAGDVFLVAVAAELLAPYVDPEYSERIRPERYTYPP